MNIFGELKQVLVIRFIDTAGNIEYLEIALRITGSNMSTVSSSSRPCNPYTGSRADLELN
jgi:hypothetical protein